MPITDARLSIILAIFGIGLVGLIIFMAIGIPIIEHKHYDNVTINSKWLQRECSRYGCSDVPMINTTSGNFVFQYLGDYLNIQPNTSYSIDTAELGMGYGFVCMSGRCRAIQNMTII